jgi:hypothetical protein
VIHENPASETSKTRGHLGSQCRRKGRAPAPGARFLRGRQARGQLRSPSGTRRAPQRRRTISPLTRGEKEAALPCFSVVPWYQ